MISRQLVTCFVVGSLLAALPADAQRRNKEEVTQTLEVLPDPPQTVTVETSRLVFFVSPLTTKGLLSQQVRDAIKNIWKVSKGAQIVKLRALVAGTGDLRRVQAIVSEMFTEKRQQLPALSVIQVGGLANDSAQVVLEAVGVAKKPANAHGLAFLSGQQVTAPIDASVPSTPLTPLAAKSMARLRTALKGLGLTALDTVRVTCFASSLDDYHDVQRLVSSEFPKAAINIVQVTRAPLTALMECEAVARLNKPIGAPVKFVNPPGLDASPNYSQVTLVGSKRVVLTGTQLAFRYQDSDVRLAFDRLKGSLEEAGVRFADVAMSCIYPLSPAMTDKIRELRFEYYNKGQPPASTMLLFQGLPSLDASFAVDVIAAVPDSNS